MSVNQNIGSDAKMARVQIIVGINRNGLLAIELDRLRRDDFENVLLKVRQRSIDKLEMKKDIAFKGVVLGLIFCRFLDFFIVFWNLCGLPKNLSYHVIGVS